MRNEEAPGAVRVAVAVADTTPRVYRKAWELAARDNRWWSGDLHVHTRHSERDDDAGGVECRVLAVLSPQLARAKPSARLVLNSLGTPGRLTAASSPTSLAPRRATTVQARGYQRRRAVCCAVQHVELVGELVEHEVVAVLAVERGASIGASPDSKPEPSGLASPRFGGSPPTFA